MDINSYVSRWVAFGAASLAALAAAFVANEAQILFGLHLDKGTLVGYLAPFLLGTFALAWKWLENRGRQELSALERDVHLSPAIIAEIEKLIESHLPPAPVAGQEAANKEVVAKPSKAKPAK
jgi:hypothetical protein